MKSKRAIGLLQETGSTKATHEQWEREWGGEIIFSDGDYNSRGVAIVLPKGVNADIIFKDNDGRLIIAWIPILEAFVCSVYAPVRSKENEKLL